MELLVNDQAKNAILSLEKAKTLISWPTCLYALGMAFDKSFQIEKATLLFSSALECFDERLSMLDEVVPESLPDRAAFLKQLGAQLDGQVRLLGFENMEELKASIQMGISGAKAKKDPSSEMPSTNNTVAFKYANKVKALLVFYAVWAVIGYIKKWSVVDTLMSPVCIAMIYCASYFFVLVGLKMYVIGGDTQKRKIPSPKKTFATAKQHEYAKLISMALTAIFAVMCIAMV